MYFLKTAAPAKYTPNFHSQGHINWWYSSPFSGFDPHLTLAVFLFIIIFGVSCFLYMKRKKRDRYIKWNMKHNEKQFQDLLNKKTLAMEKLLDLEEDYERGKVSKEEYEEKAGEYKAYLYNITKKLNNFVR